MKQLRPITLAAALIFSVSAAQGSAVYNYTGNSFDGQVGTYGGSFEQIDITLTFDQPLLPFSAYSGTSGAAGATLTDWSIGDGLFDLSPSSPGLLFSYLLSTDQFGQIDVWTISAQTTDSTGVQVSDYSNVFYDLATIAIPTPDGEDDSFAFIYASPGEWSGGGAAVPEPGSFVLVLGALAAAAAHRLRKLRA